MVSASLAYPLPVAKQKADHFYAAFLISLALISIPVKNFAYVAPLVYLAFQARNGNSRLISRVVFIGVLATLFSSISLLYDSSRLQVVNVPGMLLALLTYLPIIIAVSHPRIPSLSEGTFKRLQTACALFVIVQSLIGVLQFAMSGNPDAICGTFGLLDFRFYTRITISQVYFTFTVFSMVLFMILDAKRRLIQVAIGTGILVCVLAQSGHQTLFFIGSLAVIGLSRIARPKIVILSLVVIASVVALVDAFYPNTFAMAAEWRRKIYYPDSPKRLAVEAGFTVMDDSKNLLLGTGLGQFCSRAALITSNEYLSVKLPTLLVGKSEYFSRHIEPANDLFQDHGEGSAIVKPYCSLVSICVEAGLAGALLLGIVFAAHFFRNGKWMRSKQPWISLCGTFANIGVLFFALCCTIENYAEFAQAIFLPILLYVAAISRAEAAERERAYFCTSMSQTAHPRQESSR